MLSVLLGEQLSIPQRKPLSPALDLLTSILAGSKGDDR